MSSLQDQSGGEQNCGQRDQCQQRKRAAAAASGGCDWTSAAGVVAAMAVPAEHGDIATPLVAETRVGPVVDREPAA